MSKKQNPNKIKKTCFFICKIAFTMTLGLSIQVMHKYVCEEVKTISWLFEKSTF